jgi:hypothetical protein
MTHRNLKGTRTHPKGKKTLGDLNETRLKKFSVGVVGGGHSRYRRIVVTHDGVVYVSKKGQSHSSLKKEWGIPGEEIMEETVVRRGPGSDINEKGSTFFYLPHTTPETRKVLERKIKNFHTNARFEDAYISQHA